MTDDWCIEAVVRSVGYGHILCHYLRTSLVLVDVVEYCVELAVLGEADVASDSPEWIPVEY